MIRIDRGLVDVPESLADDAAKAAAETQAAIDHYEKDWDGKTSYSYAAYKAKDIKEQLEALFAGKCAYCEGTYDNIAPVDIEHFRPKGEVVVRQADGTEKAEAPGYYWLAADWDNLLPSCIDCNRRRIQVVEEDEGLTTDPRGKQNLFPLADEAKRVRSSVKWKPTTSEQGVRLLLHPCVDEPGEHLTFVANGTVRACDESEMGKQSILVFGLDRVPLNERRRATALELAQRMRTCRVLIDELGEGPDEDLKAELSRILSELESRTYDDQPFAALSRTLVDSFLAALRDGRLNDHLAELFSLVTRPGDPVLEP